MGNDEYILADKAYQVDKHIITPYKLPVARQPSYKAFNKALSEHRPCFRGPKSSLVKPKESPGADRRRHPKGPYAGIKMDHGLLGLTQLPFL
jgi:hypothetical protein